MPAIIDAHRADGGDGLAPWVGAVLAVALGGVGAGALCAPARRLVPQLVAAQAALLASASSCRAARLSSPPGVADRPQRADGLLSNSALTPNVAIGLSLLWVVGLIVALFLYHRTIDDHERQAYLWAGTRRLLRLCYPCPVWWVLARADLAPPVDAMLLFALSMIVNAVVYFWFKFR